MASSVSNTEQTSTIKNKVEEVSAAESSVIASGRPSSEAASQAQEGISTKSVVPKRCARQYKAPRWKSYHLPAVKYELLIYAQLFMAAIAMIAMKDIAMLPWNKVAKLREAVNRLNSLDLTDEEVDLIVDEFLKQDTDKRKCGLLNLSNAKTSQVYFYSLHLS
ncbi:unnamed protein product [Anisakis simplex]|uniref:Transmembrane protein n=1 Tax=Anisakis simplex TaxID=6269 RepID=A0A0M3J6I5_ANISI|nr:unnamed protein product [Anisakis simplex]